MEKLFSLSLLAFSFLLVFPKTGEAVEGCCSYHGGVAGFTCADGTPIPVSSPACINAPRDYYQNLLNQCQELQALYEQKAEYTRREAISGAALTGGSLGFGGGNAGLADYYKKEAEKYKTLFEDTKQRCLAIMDEYEYNFKIFQKYLLSDKCGLNSSSSNNGNCSCNEGYEWESTDDETNLNCILKRPACIDTINGYYDSVRDGCFCNDGFSWSSAKNRCISQEEFCEAKGATHQGNGNCFCREGFIYNEEIDHCEESEEWQQILKKIEDLEKKVVDDETVNTPPPEMPPEYRKLDARNKGYWNRIKFVENKMKETEDELEYKKLKGRKWGYLNRIRFVEKKMEEIKNQYLLSD